MLVSFHSLFLLLSIYPEETESDCELILLKYILCIDSLILLLPPFHRMRELYWCTHSFILVNMAT